MKCLRALLVFSIAAVPGIAAPPQGVRIAEHEDRLTVTIDGELFTEYWFRGYPKPFFYPIVGPEGIDRVRHFPMKRIEGESRDHHHHRGLFYSHVINGVNFWLENPNTGKIVHRDFQEIRDGPVGVIRSTNLLVSAGGEVIGTDERTYRIFKAADGGRFLDFEVTHRATHGELIFQDTREGAIALRIADPFVLRFRPDGPKREGLGRFVSSEGVRDFDIWGTRGKWVAIHAPVDGRVAGIALFDHPGNPRHPTWWHVRDYGLFAANPFGVHEFERLDNTTAGEMRLSPGESVTFRYRLYAHDGDEREGRVAEHYGQYERERMQIVLAGGEAAEDALRALEVFLDTEYGMDCRIVLAGAAAEPAGLLKELRSADAVFVYLDGGPLPTGFHAALQELVRSGKGAVAVGTPPPEASMIGAAYKRPWKDGLPIESIKLRPHGIFSGAEAYSASGPVGAYVDLAADVHLLAEARHGDVSTPVAWTRLPGKGRLFFFAPDSVGESGNPDYLRILGNGILWAARREIPGVGVRIQRTWMQDAHPSSFAVGFPSGLNYCFDPVAGTIAYAWDGDFVELFPAVGVRVPENAVVHGEIFYRSSGEGFSRTGGEEGTVRFLGYAPNGGIPEFRYEVDGIFVREQSGAPEGSRPGLTRRFRVESRDEPAWYRPHPRGRLIVDKGATDWRDGHLYIPAGAVVEFHEFIPRQ